MNELQELHCTGLSHKARSEKSSIRQLNH